MWRNPQEKYEKASYRNLARVIAAESGDDDIAVFIRRATFNVLIGNRDMHLKNWSLIYRAQRHAFADYSVDELEHLVPKAALPRQLVIDTAKETVALFMQRWKSEKHHLAMSKELQLAIDKHLQTLPILAAQYAT